MPETHRLISAAVAHASKAPFDIEPVMLRRPGPNEILIRCVATGICHTDIMNKTNGLCGFPAILGHEGVGVVEEVGERVAGLEPGDHVIATFDACGECDACAHARPSYCRHHGELNFGGLRKDGAHAHRLEPETGDIYGAFFQQSSFATHAVTNESNTLKVDRSLPLALMAPLACGVQTGAGAVLNTLALQAGQHLVIFGAGSVGLSALLAARMTGAGCVVVVDLNTDRLGKARALGADATFNPADEGDDLVEKVMAVTDGGSHGAIDTTGNTAVMEQALKTCRPTGTAAIIAPGVPGTRVAVSTHDLLPGRSLRGVVQGDSNPGVFIPHLIDQWQQGRFPFDKLITFYQGLEQLNQAVEDMAHGRSIKPVIIIDASYEFPEATR